jgi:hypothetical protein
MEKEYYWIKWFKLFYGEFYEGYKRILNKDFRDYKITVFLKGTDF